jgi:hypothetical protein
MEPIRVVWIFIFLFFALILIFTWSKMAIISGKVKAIARLLESLEEISKNSQQQMPSAGENEAKT